MSRNTDKVRRIAAQVLRSGHSTAADFTYDSDGRVARDFSGAYSVDEVRAILGDLERVQAAFNIAGKACAYPDCSEPLPGPYGKPGVAMSRADNHTLICSRCGTREALHPEVLAQLRELVRS
jgi:hypothetical protein